MPKTPIDAALEILGTRRLLLSIHDQSFPSRADEEIGRGSPYSLGGYDFLSFIRSLGFNGIQCGPQGRTSRGNASPYDSTAFSRNPLSLAFSNLPDRWRSLVDRSALDHAVESTTLAAADRTDHEQAYDTNARLLTLAHEAYTAARAEARSQADGPAAGACASDSRGPTGAFDEFRAANRRWLEPDSVYQALTGDHDSLDWTTWADSRGDRTLFCAGDSNRATAERRIAEIRRQNAVQIERYELAQFLVHEQHAQFHRAAREIGVALLADLQVGLSSRDIWRLQPLFMPGYRLGAPPSRTNSEGQPWGYRVLDPAWYTASTSVGSVVDYLRARSDKLMAEFDGVRIDHPQGLVCPWVYRDDDPDPFHAVQNGARLFSSPDLPDHPGLRAYAIARPDQLARGEDSRHVDGWVTDLDDDQVERYSTLLAVVVDSARRFGRDARDVACETLSTQPYPLKRVMERYGLGRFRITQKMKFDHRDDPYRSDRAARSDWIMMGNHDTPSIWNVVDRWHAEDRTAEPAAYLARRLMPADQVDRFERALRDDAGQMVHALFADVLVSDAENAVVFFADLIGRRETYNTPGTVGSQNWSLRVPPSYRDDYARQAPALGALNIAYSASLALRSPLVRHPDADRLAYRLSNP